MKRKILIVEDNVGLSQIQKDWLSQAGYEAVTAMNEPIARSLIRKTQFDLILSDVRLPEGDGISLLGHNLRHGTSENVNYRNIHAGKSYGRVFLSQHTAWSMEQDIQYGVSA